MNIGRSDAKAIRDYAKSVKGRFGMPPANRRDAAVRLEANMDRLVKYFVAEVAARMVVYSFDVEEQVIVNEAMALSEARRRGYESDAEAEAGRRIPASY